MAGALGSDKVKTHPAQFFHSVRAFSQIEEIQNGNRES